jgi:hypothetical protein
LLTPVKVFQENPTLIHEIGNATHSAGSFMYYVRWIQPTGADWQIAFDCFPIGEAAGKAMHSMMFDNNNNAPGNSTKVIAALDTQFMTLYNKQVSSPSIHAQLSFSLIMVQSCAGFQRRGCDLQPWSCPH